MIPSFILNFPVFHLKVAGFVLHAAQNNWFWWSQSCIGFLARQGTGIYPTWYSTLVWPNHQNRFFSHSKPFLWISINNQKTSSLKNTGSHCTSDMCSLYCTASTYLAITCTSLTNFAFVTKRCIWLLLLLDPFDIPAHSLLVLHVTIVSASPNPSLIFLLQNSKLQSLLRCTVSV